MTVQLISGFLLMDRADDLPVVPGARYVPLYEGRMVHQFDHAAKAYVSGEGRGAKWRDLEADEKNLVPHYYVDSAGYPSSIRACFCNVTGQTNERSLLATVIPEAMPAADTVPVVDTDNVESALVWVSVANSFCCDFLVRQKISTHLSYFYVEALPLFRPKTTSFAYTDLKDRAAQLVSITQEIHLGEPALDPRGRALLRAEIDAIVAGLYNLSPSEFAYILTTFPLLDRDQPPLPGDLIVRWSRQGKPKEEPKSYVTRDTALLAYFRHLNQEPPVDLAIWYRDEVGINMVEDPMCPFRMGPIRSLEARVAEHHRRGGIAYIPSKAKKWDPNGPYRPPALPSDWRSWIIEDRDIRGGALTLKGTRLSVDEVKTQLAAKSFEEIRNSFPQLTDAHIAVALAAGVNGA
jgi:uncharacterized protein (DUF433 family)